MPLGRRVVAARFGHQRLVLVAAALTILMAATLLTALWIYGGAATTVSARNALLSEPEIETSMQIETTGDTLEVVDDADATIRPALEDAFAAVDHTIATRLMSGITYTLPDRANEETDEEATVFAWLEALADHATLTAGEWPAPATSGEPVPVAVQSSVAALLGVAPGDEFEVVQRLDQVPVRVVLSGTYDVVDPENWYWRADPLLVGGTRAGADFPTRGPLVVADRDTLATAVATHGLNAGWMAGPDWSGLEGEDVDATTAGVLAIEEGVAGRSVPGAGVVRVESGLDVILPAIQRALLANRSMMVIPVIQLAILAAYTLLLAARLLLEHRRAEMALLRARGTSTGQIVRLALVEAVWLVLPAAVLAPLLALGLLRLVEGKGPFVLLGDSIGTPQAAWWVVSIGAAVVCALALILPTLRRDKTYVESQAERGRQARRTMLQRAGGDLLLLAGAGLAYLQLRHYQLPVIESGGEVSIDPLLVLGPSLVLFAAGLVALRALPWIARAAQRVAVARPTLGGALGAWQVARRPLRYAGPALLLVFALAIGAMSTAYGASWEQSQVDQATFRAGADIRVSAPATVEVVPPFGQASGLEAAPATTAVVPAYRGTTHLGDETVGFLALDALEAGPIVDIRSDLGPPADELLPPLAAARPQPVSIVLPGEPATVGLTVSTDLQPERPVTVPLPATAASVALIVADSNGTVVTTPPVIVDVGVQDRLAEFDIPPLASGDSGVPSAAPSYPLTLLGAQVVMPIVSVVEDIEDPGVIRAEEIVALTSSLTANAVFADGAEVPVPDDWRFETAVRVDARAGAGQLTANPISDGVFDVRATSAATSVGGTAQFRLAAADTVAELPVVLDETAAAAASASVGEVVALTVSGRTIDGLVTAIVEAFPGTDPETGVVIADLGTVQQRALADTSRPVVPTEWWIGSSDPAATTAALSAQPKLAPDLVSSDALATTLRAAGATTLGALLAGFAAALAFAAVGFTVNLIIGTRERLGEFAVLRALGLSRRQVAGMLLVEQAFLVGLGIAVGLAIGVGVSALVVPLVVLSPTAGATIPKVLLDVPWELLATTALLAAVALGCIVVIAANRLGRVAVATGLRTGDE